jgi:FkbM family methyltransferase
VQRQSHQNRWQRLRQRLADAWGALRGTHIHYARRTYRHHRISFSQSGEDLLLMQYFQQRSSGLYVDIGAHDPTWISNTYLLYLKGWCGLVIDPLPGTRQKFAARRPRDTALEIGIAAEAGTMTYYAFSHPAANTFVPGEAERQLTRGRELLGTQQVPVRPLRDVLDEYLTAGQQIDLLSIDAEGLDLAILISNDWQRYRPELVLVETHEPLESFDGSEQAPELHRYLRQQGYTLTARIGENSLYRDAARGAVKRDGGQAV